MESVTKFQIKPEMLSNIIAKAFPSRKGLRYTFSALDGGYFNNAFAVSFSDGFRTALKISPTADVKVMAHERNIMEAEVEAIRLVRLKTSVPAPEIYFYDKSKAEIPSEYFFMELIDGEPLDKAAKALNPDELFAIDLRTAECVREMAEITGTRFGFFSQPEKQRKSWRQFFWLALSLIIEDGISVNADFRLSPELIIKAVEKHDYILDEITKPHLVHWDLWQGNIFVKNGKLSSIIDFERCMWADPLMENIFTDYDNLKPAFLWGAGISGMTENQYLRRRIYSLYLMATMVTECYFRGYVDSWIYSYSTQGLKKEVDYLLR